tara:strand:- start:8997 stop:10346 length:1350 start_codon:yes stop_codon:yes gene_type:complete
MNIYHVLKIALALIGIGFLFARPVSAQENAEKRGSDNITVVAHLPLGEFRTISDVEVEQSMSRPYAYVGRQLASGRPPETRVERGMDVIDIHDPSNPKVIHRWRIEDPDLHVGGGGKDIKTFSWDGRHYVVLSTQFGQGGPDGDLGAIIFDVTDISDTLTEVARIQGPLERGGFHNIYVYKHSNGRVLLFATVSAPHANIYDLGYVVEGRVDEALVANVPVPESSQTRGGRGYHDFYTGYHADSEQDRFYGGGTGGYYVYNVTDLENPELLVSLTGINGVRRGHTFTPSPDGRYVVAETEYQYAPLRIFDLKPGLDGEVVNINRPISAWTPNWQNLVHNHEVRWPLVFVSGYRDGLQVFTLQDPKNPKTVGHYDTDIGPEEGVPITNGAWGVDVRNSDGLILISDMSTGLWLFRMEGFKGWNGLDWGMPNISSEQDFDNGPAVQAITRQ